MLSPTTQYNDICMYVTIRWCVVLSTGAVRGDVVPGGSGLGKRLRGDVRKGQHKRGWSIQGTIEPGEDQVRPGPVVEAELGAKTVVAVRRRFGPGVDGAHAGATCAPAEKGERQRRQRRRQWRRRWQREIEAQLVFDIIRNKNIEKKPTTSNVQ